MKKILFATASIVAFSAAGAAMADVEVTGEARLGLFYQDNGEDSDVDGTSRIRVKFTMTGTSDSGLTFGANIRGDNAVGGNDQGSEAPIAFDNCDGDCSGHVSTGGDAFVSGSFGTLTYGDTDSAVKTRVSHVDAISLTGLGDVHEVVLQPQSGPRIRYDYDFDSFGFSLSTEGEIDDYAIGASYSGDFGGTTIDFGIGYDNTEFSAVSLGDAYVLSYETDGTIAASLGAGFGAFGFKVAYVTNQLVDMDIAVSVSYDAGDLDVTAFYRQFDLDGDANVFDSIADLDLGGQDVETDGSAYGIGASYDLGGGLVAKAGLAITSLDDDISEDDFIQADLGLAMTF